ncbi:response regulator [Desulfobacter vibrioformis]|uniref:response regulator n=1 Tax=Desulfobacter vibrioformis TaxID=34031 RepID=UPI0009FFFC12|nr:response regulator [Desulfobacter vibrioformis]
MAKVHTGEIQLLITDVVMPEMNGRELADPMILSEPNLNLLFMSGYTSDVITRRGVLDKGVGFIQKPFSMKELAIKVYEALGKASDTV